MERLQQQPLMNSFLYADLEHLNQNPVLMKTTEEELSVDGTVNNYLPLPCPGQLSLFIYRTTWH
jgi:hypothetical protein